MRCRRHQITAMRRGLPSSSTRSNTAVADGGSGKSVDQGCAIVEQLGRHRLEQTIAAIEQCAAVAVAVCARRIAVPAQSWIKVYCATSEGQRRYFPQTARESEYGPR